jgi:hypothetical protein
MRRSRLREKLQPSGLIQLEPHLWEGIAHSRELTPLPAALKSTSFSTGLLSFSNAFRSSSRGDRLYRNQTVSREKLVRRHGEDESLTVAANVFHCPGFPGSGPCSLNNGFGVPALNVGVVATSTAMTSQSRVMKHISLPSSRRRPCQWRRPWKLAGGSTRSFGLVGIEWAHVDL